MRYPHKTGLLWYYGILLEVSLSYTLIIWIAEITLIRRSSVPLLSALFLYSSALKSYRSSYSIIKLFKWSHAQVVFTKFKSYYLSVIFDMKIGSHALFYSTQPHHVIWLIWKDKVCYLSRLFLRDKFGISIANSVLLVVMFRVLRVTICTYWRKISFNLIFVF